MSSLNIPRSTSTVNVSIIDTTARLHDIPIAHFFGPALQGFETWRACAYALLITHTNARTGKERRIVLDLGVPKDWENDLPPTVTGSMKGLASKIEIEKCVSEILEENGVPLESLEAVVWSHAHFDHVGRVSLFPPTVALILGPGLKEACYPGYPALETSPVLERDLAGREIKSLDFPSSDLTIGGSQAIDFFGDGSFYFLSAPGHAVGHINALARTTNADDESTFILLGADSYHHCSQLRPSERVALPDEIPGPIPNFDRYRSMCPGHVFNVLHPSHPQRIEEIPAHYAEVMSNGHSNAHITPYFTISARLDGSSIAPDLNATRGTISGLQNFDPDENVFLVSAHDRSLFEELWYFPDHDAHDWKAKGRKEKGRWRFLGDLKKAVDIANEKKNLALGESAWNSNFPRRAMIVVFNFR